MSSGAAALSTRNQPTESSSATKDLKPFLPVLIIPGFMSSGLEVIKSSHKESWEGKRIWINLKSLGFEALPFIGGSGTSSGGTSNNEDDVLSNMWLQHMALNKDMMTEREGVQVRNIPGLEGVDYLTPGALTNFVSYVFGPVIQAFQNVGYNSTDTINLDAAPYDWRLAPNVLEERDSYFTNTLNQIETMHNNNNKTPVVLVCHSMGCKMGHYLLNFALQQRGREWIDEHVHTYVPIGGPHLGAPAALRSIVTGDKMGLEAFIKDKEALILGRSLSSGLLLIPGQLPRDAPSNAFLRKNRAVQLSILGGIDTDIFLNKRQASHRPDKLKLVVQLEDANNSNALSTPFVAINHDQSVSFDEQFVFRTGDDNGPCSLTLLLCEPGVAAARKSTTAFNTGADAAFNKFFRTWRCDCCGGEDPKFWMWPDPKHPCRCFLNILFFWWLIWPLLRFSIELAFKLYFGALYVVCWCMCRGTVLGVDKVSKMTGGSSVLASANLRNIQKSRSVDGDTTVEVDLVSKRDSRGMCSCCKRKRKTTLTLRITWLEPRQSTAATNSVCAPISEHWGKELSGLNNRKSKGHPQEYEALSGFELLKAAHLESAAQSVKTIFDSDPLDARGISSHDAPPVNKVKAIYGINIATEVGAVYKRSSAEILKEDEPHSLFALDTRAELKKDGYTVNHGILMETSGTRQLIKGSSTELLWECKSGDGTVPYYSMQHVRTWADRCDVTTEELDGAPHREILADKRLHQILIDYVCRRETDAMSAV